MPTRHSAIATAQPALARRAMITLQQIQLSLTFCVPMHKAKHAPSLCLINQCRYHAAAPIQDGPRALEAARARGHRAVLHLLFRYGAKMDAACAEVRHAAPVSLHGASHVRALAWLLHFGCISVLLHALGSSCCACVDVWERNS